MFEACIKHRHHFIAFNERLLLDVYFSFGVHDQFMDDGPDHAKLGVVGRLILIDVGH